MILLTNTAEDSELRIGAYLALMSCPSQETVNQVKMVLTDEPVNQGTPKYMMISIIEWNKTLKKLNNLLIIFYRLLQWDHLYGLI